MTRQPVRPLWLLLVAGSIITSLSLGVRSTFGLFVEPVIETIGVSRGTIGLSLAIQNLVWGLTQPFAGAVADRFGTTKVLVTGAGLYAVGLVLMSQATSGATFHLSAGLVIGIATGAASFSVVLASVGRMVAPSRRSLALGITTAMGSVGQFVLVPVTQRLLEGWDWQQVAVALAGVIAAVIIFAPVFRGSSAEQMEASGESSTADGETTVRPLRSELRRAAHSRSYWLLNGAFFVCGFHVTFIAVHLASYADQIGQSTRIAAWALSAIGLFNIVGSLTAGILGGRYRKTRLLTIIYFLRAVVIGGFILVPASDSSFLLFGALIGLLWLSTVPLTSGMVVSMFGPAYAGTLFGIVFLSHQLGAFAGAWLGGTVTERVGSYVPVWWIAVALGLVAAVLHLFINEGLQPLPPPPVQNGIRTGVVGAAGAVLLALLVAGSLGVGQRAASAAVSDDNHSLLTRTLTWCAGGRG